VPISGEPEIGCGEPGTHNHGAGGMDSGLACYARTPE